MARGGYRSVVLAFFLCAATSLWSQVPKWKEWEAKGDTLYNHEDYKDAIKYYNKAIAKATLKEKDAYKSLYKRAVCYYSTQEFSKALSDVETFIKEFPDRPQPWMLKAFIYRELNDDDQQLASLEQALRLQGPNPDLMKWRGLLYLQKDDYKNAKKDMLMVRELQDDPEVETYLGLCYYNLEQTDSSFVSFNRSIELDATYLPAYLYAGSLCLESEDFRKGLEYIELALRLDPKNKEALFYKGVALVELKRTDEGCKCLNRAFYAGFDDAADYLKEYCFQVED